MSALVVKTGMTVEQTIVRKYVAPGTLVLTGEYTANALDEAVPSDCEAIISVGVCGGLAPAARIGQAFIYDSIYTPACIYGCDPAWRQRLFAVTKYYERLCYSSGQFNTANNPVQRAQLYHSTGCWIIDDESYAVAQFASKRKIAFIGLRTVSDGATDTLPPAVVNALNPDGSTNLWNVLASVVAEPSQIPALIQTALNAKRSYDELATACIAVGPNFQWGV
jgi:adenosylhomocysteine nucleosidase